MGLHHLVKRLAPPLAAAALALAPGAAPAAAAPVTAAFGGAVPCTTDAQGLRICQGDVAHRPASFDGTPIDVNLVLPAVPAGGRDGEFPLLGIYHGWGGAKLGVDQLKRWAKQGYAAFSMTDRGFGDSCGSLASRTMPACAHGYIHLLDDRYEVRDAQYLIGLLADQLTGGRPLVDGQRIGATGPSYGGGMSMALAALKDRVMLPDGSLAPWTSPAGRPLRIAAAAPEIPWSDLAYALVPNGRFLDTVTDNRYGPRVGVAKLSFITGLYALGQTTGYYAAPGQDPQADIQSWYARILAGETTDTDPTITSILNEIEAHHSSYTIDHSEPPAPLLISNGWTDDLFPVDEAIRFYNRTRSQWPGSPLSLFFLDYGHQRGQNKPADLARLARRQRDWFAYYLKGDQTVTPLRGVETLTTTCPASAPSGGPFQAASWRQLAGGSVRYATATPQAITGTGDPAAGQAFDPISGPGACATAPGADAPDTANYRLPAVGAAYTLLGFPTVIASIASPGSTNQLAARLLDVAPDGTETLVARALYRPVVSATPVRQTFQLHADAWRFAPGHVPKLELLTADPPYSRPSNGQTPMTVTHLELRLPTG